jgi:hypothetical protein
MSRRRPPPLRPRLHVEELEPRLLYSADAALLLDPTLGGAVEMRLLAPAPAAPAEPVAPALQALALLDDATQQRELVLVDARVANPYAALDALVARRGGGASYDLVVLEADRPAPVQVTELLQLEQEQAQEPGQEQGLGAVHLIGWHGAAAAAQIPATAAQAGGADVFAWRVSPLGELSLLTQPEDAAATPDASLQPLRRELIFVDSRVEDLAHVLEPLIDAAPGDVVFELIPIDAGADGLAQISAALAGRQGIDALHLISHGASGALLLGSGTVDAAVLAARADEVAAWSAALDAEADLLLYGCEVAADATGQAFVAALADLTGADVAASTDATGAAERGGDWLLETRIGRLQTPVLQAEGWSGTLALTSQGGETLVNTSTAGSQTNNWSGKTVAMDANGNFVGVWMDGSGAGGDAGYGIYAQRYNAAGMAQGSQIHVNTYLSDNQRNPQVAMAGNGSFVVVWESNSQDGSSYGIYAQRYDASGGAQGSEFRVNTGITYDQKEAAVAMDATGNFVITWQSWSQDAVNSNGIYAQRYNSSGVAQGGEFKVNTYTTDDQSEPGIGMDSSGNFVIAWGSWGQDGSDEGIYAQRYDSSGVAQGSEFSVNTYSTGYQGLPVVAMDGNGFVVVWESSAQDGDLNGIYGQRYNSSGVAQGSEFRVNTTTANQQQNPVAAMTTAGGFVVTWQSYAQDGSFDGVYARQYDGSGTALTAETRVNTTTTDYQDLPGVAADANGHLVVVWHGNGSGDSDGIFMQRYLYAVAPVLTLSGYSDTYVENAGVIFDASATVTDADTTVFSGGQLLYQITANGSSSDELGIRNQGSGAGLIGLSGSNVTYGGTVIGSYSGSAGAGSFGNGSTLLTVDFNSNASVAAVQALVRNVTFRDTSDNPSTATRTISLTVSDGTGMTSTPAVVTMAVTAVNDAPVITSNGGGASASVSVAETRTAVTTVTSTDADGGTAVYSIAGGADAAKFTLDASTGALAFITAPDYEAPTDSGADNVYNVTVQVSDGAGGSDTQAIAVTVTDVAATLVVDTASDNNDSGITAGNAAHTAEWLNAQPGADGKVSLREAIMAANNTTGVDTISFSIGAGGAQTIALSAQLPEITDAVVIDGSTQSGYAGTPLIVLDGSSAPIAANGLSISAGGSTVRGLGIQNFGLYGIYLTSGGGNLIEGNHIGINAAGGTAAGNGFGIVVSGSAGNTIGGTTTAARNLISGNSQIGIRITGAAATGNTVAGNYVGLNAAGTAAVANGEIGINIEAGASSNTIGGATAASRNVVSGNIQFGVCVSDAATSHNTVQNNYLGTNAAGNAALSNGGFGLVIDFGAAHTSVLDNVISGNTNASWSASRGGIYLSGNASTIQGNIIGLDATGTTVLGNGGGSSTAGIYEAGSSNGALIGGTSAGQGNIIAGNTGAGVVVKTTGNVQLLGNSIYGNSGLGIDLANDGVTANDAAPDADSGANGLQNFPVLSSAATTGSQIHIEGTLASDANSWFRVEFFASGTADVSGHGEGQRSIGYANVATDASGQATVNAVLTASVAAGESVTATATRSDAGYATFTDTSEFSATVTATSNVAPVNTLPGAQTVNEDAALAIGGVSVGDGNGNLASTQLSVVQGTLSVTLAGGATISAGANGTATLTLSGTQAQINAALASLTYQGATNFNGSDTLSVTSTDSLGLTDSDALAITVTAVNDAPSLSTATALPSITEDAGQHAGFLVSLLASGATDADSGALQGIAVTGLDNSHGTWQYTLDGSSWADIGSVSGSSARLLPSDATARIRFVPDADWNGSTGLFNYRAWDQTDGVAGALADTTANGGSTAYSSGESGSSLAVSAVNDAPVNQLPGTQLTALNTPLLLSVANGNAIQVADVDAASAALRIELSVTHGSLTLAQTTGLSFSVGDGSADASMTFTGTLTDVNAALNGATFTPAVGYSGSALLTLASSDQGASGSGGALSDSDILTIAVGGARFQEGADGYSGTHDTWVSTGSPSINRGSEAEVIADDDSATDAALLRFEQLFGSGAGQIPWGATIESATLSVYVTDRDLADAVSLHRMLVSWSEASTYNSLTSGVGSAGGEIGAALLSFDSGVSGWNSLSSAGLTATVQAWADGEANQGWAFVSNNADLWTFASSENGSVALRPYLTVTYSLPQAPVLTASGGTAGYVENAAPVAVDPGLTVSDADSTQLSSAVIRIGTGYASSQDQLQFTDQNGITGLWNSGTGTLTLSGTASLAHYQTALRSVAYVNSSDTPATDTRTVEFSVTDAVSGLTGGLVSRSLTVQAVNDAPTVVSPIADQSATEDSAFSFTFGAGTFADVDAGDSLSYSTSALPGWLNFDAVTRTFSGTPANADVGTVTITVTATDGTGATASDSFDIVVGNVNDAPTLVSPIADQSATEDSAFSFQLPAGTFADVDAGDSLSYSTSALPGWLNFDAVTRTFSGTPANADVGTVTITVTATDGTGATASDSFDIVVGNVNDAPTLVSPIADQSATEDSAFSFQLPAGTFADVDAGDSLSYSTSALPGWLNFDAVTRTFSGTPANADVGTVTITVTATDGTGATASDSFDIVVGNVNDAPTLVSPIADQSATEDSAFSFQLPAGTFADVDAGDSLSYSTSALPGWLNFDAVTRTFSGTPANADVGTVTITVTATDGMRRDGQRQL